MQARESTTFREFVSVILCSSLRSSFEQFLYYGSKALGVVKSTQ